MRTRAEVAGGTNRDPDAPCASQVRTYLIRETHAHAICTLGAAAGFYRR